MHSVPTAEGAAGPRGCTLNPVPRPGPAPSLTMELTIEGKKQTITEHITSQGQGTQSSIDGSKTDITSKEELVSFVKG
jgi:hypothetical protein